MVLLRVGTGYLNLDHILSISNTLDGQYELLMVSSFVVRFPKSSEEGNILQQWIKDNLIQGQRFDESLRRYSTLA
jgi:hypothetical protein